MNTQRIGTHYAKPRHLRNVLAYLCKAHSRYLDPSANSDVQIANWINSNFLSADITTAHYAVVDMYKSGEVSRRGRPFGALNKNKRDYSLAQAAIDQDIDQMLATPVQETVKPNGSASARVDLSNYVTRPELQACNNAIIELSKNMAQTFVSADDRLTKLEQSKPTIIELRKPDAAPVIIEGVQHCAFPDLITALQARQFNNLPLNAWLYGPAGTGKSKACECAIKLFGKDFFGNGKTIDKIEVLGYQDGYGKYHRTQFREAFEHGHGYCADEIDSWSPEATTALQGALAGDWAAFPDGMIKRHPDFIFIAAGNTTGKGATIEYVGRMQQDAAFLDRFVFVDWPHDNALEDSLVSNKRWLEYVRNVRCKLSNTDIRNHLVTMRASIHGEALLAAGMAWDKVINMCLRKGLPQNNWDKIK